MQRQPFQETEHITRSTNLKRRGTYAHSRALQGLDPEFERLDARLVKAISHPLRQRILTACSERAASPSDLADEWGESRSGVAYHVRVLNDLGAIELVDEQRVRGSVKHYYRTVIGDIFDDRQWAQLPVELRRSAFDEDLRQIGEDVRNGARAKGFDDPQTHVSRTLLNLDQQAFDELSELLADAIRRVVEIRAEADERQTRGLSKPVHATELVILHFHRGEPGGDR